MDRHDFKETVKKLLAERVGYHCSNPSCGVATIGPSDTPTDKEYIGVAAHIHSASIKGGPRANPNLSEEERSSFENGIHLCNKCSTLIDKNNGDGYPAELLKNWKICAEAAAKGRIYQNSPFNLFFNVSFTNLEKDYSTALTCTGLNEKNIISCPANEEIIDEVIKKLNLANKCILAGPSGSGKSLLSFQIAYRFHMKGWNIYKINKESITSYTEIVSPKHNSIIVIDDIQTIPSQLIEKLLAGAYQECKILGNYNTNTHNSEDLLRRLPSVEILLSSQIELLKDYCYKKKNEISKTLQNIGIVIQNNSYHDCIEMRIERAAKEATPWLFNYNLTEGWNSAKSDLQLLKENDYQHLVIITIAIFQFATLDLGVSESEIILALSKYNSDKVWLEKASKTIKENCVHNEGKVRNKHYEYSRRILRIFISKKNSQKEQKYLINLIKEILDSDQHLIGHSNILEFILFDFRLCHYQLKNEDYFLELGEKLIKSKRTLSYSEINKLNSLIRNESRLKKILSSEIEVLKSWIMSCTKDTAYSLGVLLNTLYNEKFETINSGDVLVDHVFNLMESTDLEEYSRYTFLINRLLLLLDDKDREHASKVLSETDFSVSVSRYSTGMECYHFSNIIKDLYYVNQQWADKQIEQNIQTIAYLFNSDFKNALNNFKELILNYFGVVGAILGFYNPTKNIKIYGHQLANALDEDIILLGFNKINAAEIQGYSDILIFLALYNPQKLLSISDKFNYDRLEMLFRDFSKIDHYHRALVHLLQNRKSKNWMKHVSWLITSSNYLERTFFEWNSDMALEQLEKGKKYKIRIHMCSDCEDELNVLKTIYNEGGHKIAKRVIQENNDVISDAICTKSQNGDDHESKYYLLIFIYKLYPLIYKEIFTLEKNQKVVTKKLERLINGKASERKMARLYVFLLNKYSPFINEELSMIESKYSSVKDFNIKDHL